MAVLKRFIYKLAMLGVLLALIPSINPAIAWGSPAPAAPTIENLGAPLTSVRVTASATGTWTDGRPVLFAVGGAAFEPVIFAVLDLRTGETLASHTIAQASSSYDVKIAPDGQVYISAWGPAANLLRYDPQTDVLTNLGVAVAGETVLNRTVMGGNGLVYGGTYPGGKVFEYNPATGVFTNMGGIAAGEQYARSLAYASGKLYVGTEAHNRLFEIDIATGVKTEIPMPSWAGSEFRIYDLAYRGGLLFAYTSPSLDWHVYDVAAGEWVDRIKYNAQGGISEVDAQGNVYFVNLTATKLYRYNTQTRTGEPVSWSEKLTSSMGGTGIGFAELGLADYPGQSVVGLGTDGRIWQWNPTTGAGRVFQSAFPASNITIMSLGRGPDGYIYVGGSSNPGGTLAAYDTINEQLVSFPKHVLARIDAFEVQNSRLYFTVYGPGALYEYDPSIPSSGTNPKQAFALIDHYLQERIYALEEIGPNMLAAGSTGRRAVPDGHLFFYNTSTKTLVDKGVPLSGHSVTSLVYGNNGLLFGGTSVQILGMDSTQPEAKLFIWDTVQDELVWQGVPVPGAQDINDLIIGPDGAVWGLTTKGIVFRFDPDSRTVTATVQVGAEGGIWGMGNLDFAANGTLYGSTGSQSVFALDPATMSVTSLDSGEFATLDANGRLYYSRNGLLYRLTPPATEDTSAGVKLSGPASVNTGQSFELTYGLENVTSSVYAKSLKVHYDPSLLEYVGAESLHTDFEIVGSSTERGAVLILEASTDRNTPVTGSTDLLKLKFRALGAEGTDHVYLTNIVIADETGNETSLSSGPGHAVQIHPLQSADKSGLAAVIAEAGTAASQAKVLNPDAPRWGYYPQAAISTLNAAIAQANNTMIDAGATQGAVNQATADLTQALTAFRSTASQRAGVGDLAIISANYGATNQSSDWAAISSYDLSGDGKLDIADLAAIAQRILN